MSDKFERPEDRALPEGLERLLTTFVRVLRTRNGKLGLILLIPIISTSLLAPVLSPYDPTSTSEGPRLDAPSSDHLMGTDHLGRDVSSRVLYGGRTSLLLGLFATSLSIVFGVPIGIVAGYMGGWIDEGLMRLMDAWISLPGLLLALLIVAVLGGSLLNAVIAITLVYIPKIARIARSNTLSIRNEEYIKAAQARDESLPYIWYGEVLPNVLSPIVVEGSIRIGFAILIGTSLSFLGLGTQPPFPDWGYMIANARNHLDAAPWFLLFPSVALGGTILGFNLLGDGLRDAMDPEMRLMEEV